MLLFGTTMLGEKSAFGSCERSLEVMFAILAVAVIGKNFTLQIVESCYVTSAISANLYFLNFYKIPPLPHLKDY